MQKRRATNETDRQLRIQKLERAALHLLEEQGYHGFNMGEVARQAGLAKGTVYTYFETREALFMAVFSRLSFEWFAALEAWLSSVGENPATSRLVDFIVDTLSQHPTLRRLSVLSSTVLEENISLGELQKSKQKLYGRMAELGTCLEQVYACFRPGEGMQFLFRMCVLLVGVESMTHVPRAFREATEPIEALEGELYNVHVRNQRFATDMRALLRLVAQDYEQRS